MSNPDTQNDINELNKIISINTDACKFYQSAQEKVNCNTMQKNFGQLETLHQGVAQNLKQEVAKLGGEIEADPTVVGKVKQFYGEAMTKLSNNVDATLVSHLEEAEDRCLNSVKDCIDNDKLQASTKMILQRELQTLNRSHDYMKSMKDSMKNAA